MAFVPFTGPELRFPIPKLKLPPLVFFIDFLPRVFLAFWGFFPAIVHLAARESNPLRFAQER